MKKEAMCRSRHKKPLELPDTQLLEAAVARIGKRRRAARILLCSTLYAIVIITAVAVPAAMLWLPAFQISGSSMMPTLEEDQVVVAAKNSDFETGDMIAFYYNNKVLVKRVIARAGDWVNIDEDGTVYVNNIALDEPYVYEPALGGCNIELPYQVPESRIFVMGDHRSVSVDSRNTAVGSVAEEQVVGKLVLRIWPLDQFGALNTK